MKKYIPLLSFIFIVLCAFLGFVFASNLSQPPILKDEPLAEQQYFTEIYNNFNLLEVTETNPDGNRNGKYGQIILLKSGGNYYVEICVSSPNGTVWRGVVLSDTP